MNTVPKVMFIMAGVFFVIGLPSFYMFINTPPDTVKIITINEDTGEHLATYKQYTNNWIIPMVVSGALFLFFLPCGIIAYIIERE